MEEEDDVVARCQARIGMVLKEKWRLDSLIGVGGMAAVYSATHNRNNKRVAVKMLMPELSGNVEVRTRFLREGYAANIVEHPGSVSVLDDDVTDDGAAFLVMELLEGETLDRRWERKGHRLEPVEVLALTDQVLDVLSAAHGKGIVHRDIKPENLFFTKAGQLKILDFGIARVMESANTGGQTRAGFVMGTPAFMAPEQAMARWDIVDGRTDLWAVGASMFTLMTGHHVHEGGNGNEQLIKSATTPARPLASMIPNVPPAIASIVDKALAFDVNQRWANAKAMQEAVRAAYAALKSSGGRPGPGAPASAGRPAQGRSAAGDPGAMVPPQKAADLGPAELAKNVERINQRLQALRKRVAETQARVAATLEERSSHEQRFLTLIGTPKEGKGADEARRNVRAAYIALGKKAVSDTESFGESYRVTRDEVIRLAGVAEAKSREFKTIERAINVYDPVALKKGYIVISVAGALAVLVGSTPLIIHLLSFELSDIFPFLE